MSYATVAKPSAVPTKKFITPVKKHSVVISSKDRTAKTTVDDIKKEVTANLGAKKIRISRVKPLANGAIVETVTEEDINLIKASLEKSSIFTTGEVKRRNPKIIILGVKDKYEEDLIKKEIQEETGLETSKEIFVPAKIGKGEAKHWVVQLPPHAWRHLMSRQRLYVGWQSYKVDNYITPLRCFKCQRFGHLTKYCRAEKETCANCGEEGHLRETCKTKSEEHKCASCYKFKKVSKQHKTGDRKCPEYIRALELERSRTNYD